MNATTTTTTTATANGQYEGRFRWARQGEANVSCRLSKNNHGWFCDEVNGQEWVYPSPVGDPWGGWGAQTAKETPLAALRGFLAQWNASSDGGHGCSKTADRLTIQAIVEDD